MKDVWESGEEIGTQVIQPLESIPFSPPSPVLMTALTDLADFERRIRESCDMCGGRGELGGDDVAQSIAISAHPYPQCANSACPARRPSRPNGR